VQVYRSATFKQKLMGGQLRRCRRRGGRKRGKAIAPAPLKFWTVGKSSSKNAKFEAKNSYFGKFSGENQNFERP